MSECVYIYSLWSLSEWKVKKSLAYQLQAWFFYLFILKVRCQGIMAKPREMLSEPLLKKESNNPSHLHSQKGRGPALLSCWSPMLELATKSYSQHQLTLDIQE